MPIASNFSHKSLLTRLTHAAVVGEDVKTLDDFSGTVIGGDGGSCFDP